MVAKNSPSFLAFDLGASGGRALVGSFADKKLRIEEISRFKTGMTKVKDSWRWNIFEFFEFGKSFN